MGRRRAARRSLMNLGGSSLNLTPLLDIIFNLIFFFILATNIRDRQTYLQVDLPAAATGEERQVEKRIPQITLSRDGKILLDGTEVSEVELRTALREAVRTERVTEAVVVVDEVASFGRFVEIADVCRAEGITSVSPQVREVPQ